MLASQNQLELTICLVNTLDHPDHSDSALSTAQLTPSATTSTPNHTLRNHYAVILPVRARQTLPRLALQVGCPPPLSLHPVLCATAVLSHSLSAATPPPSSVLCGFSGSQAFFRRSSSEAIGSPPNRRLFRPTSNNQHNQPSTSTSN